MSENEVPHVSNPANGGLEAAGIRTLSELARHPATAIAALHGVGPKAMTAWTAALAEHGLEFAETDADTARTILAEMGRLAEEQLAASYIDGDRNPPVFDPETHTAPLPESFKKSFRAYMEAEWWRLGIGEELGGTTAPRSLIWACAEAVLGSNPAIWMYGSGPTFGQVVWDEGTEEQRRIAQLMVVLDVTIVNIALPSAQQELGFSDSERQWIITAYALSFGSLLLLLLQELGRRVSKALFRQDRSCYIRISVILSSFVHKTGGSQYLSPLLLASYAYPTDHPLGRRAQ